MTTSAAAPSTHPLCRDGRRGALALAVGVLLPLAVGISLNGTALLDEHVWAARTILLLLGFDLFALVYVVLTLRTFGRVGPEEFRARMRARDLPSRDGGRRRAAPVGAPAFALEATLVALAAALVLPHVDGIVVSDLILAPVTLSILVSSWALSIAAYALHYAQRDLDEPGLEFPGRRTHDFADYRYFALAVATTFGATDVAIVTPRCAGWSTCTP
ncbi:hypothetical protein Acsp06_12630 [Actinomycetospora sp. NBRC 106375]|uniref:DUF1345 domain-containing protein n=1 Tax=Actinomycetospora sp. NBRC 106375 TaxID=3032207 RepID=UPI0024A58D44|nr:DUF1345 domain-containing protein [Actinomycetospora sp. NBRC 106375]GLZ45078.1 hypothetical protein Acsp06_12630 [Actinomycetospora sp. NBRC 106375]